MMFNGITAIVNPATGQAPGLKARNGQIVEQDTPGPAAVQPSPEAIKAHFAGKIRFGHQLTRNDYIVAHGAFVPVTAETSAKTLVSLLQNALFKLSQNDTSNLKYNLHAFDGTLSGSTALADNLILLGRPIDTLVQSSAGPASVLSLQMSRLGSESRLYMSQDATIQLGPTKGVGYGTNHEWQIRRELNNEYARDLEALLRKTTGETDRAKLYSVLNRAKEFNALEALSFGKKGLIDAILIGQDQVLTREKLDEYYRSKNWNGKEISDFSQKGNIEEIPKKFLMPLSKYNAASVVPDSVGIPVQRGSYQQVSLPNQFLIFQRGLNSPGFNRIIAEKPIPQERIRQTPDFTAQFQYWLGFPLPGFIYDDCIFFHTEFTEFSAEQLIQALQALDEKKTESRKSGEKPSNIKIIVNSPGGSTIAGEEIRSAITQQETPVDVLAQGIAASCGAYLLASATGNRLATPHARILIHQPHTGDKVIPDYLSQNNDEADNIQAVTRKMTSVIAKSTGRAEKEVWKDMQQDTWMNPLEALFYGPKGLLDGILVASDKAVTREDVLEYLKTDSEVQSFLKDKFGQEKPEENVKAYLEDRLKNLREPNQVHRPDEWEAAYGRDPFSNPLETLDKLARKAKAIKDIPQLKNSASQPQATVDHFNVGLSDDNIAALLPFLQTDKAKAKEQ